MEAANFSPSHFSRPLVLPFRQSRNFQSRPWKIWTCEEDDNNNQDHHHDQHHDSDDDDDKDDDDDDDDDDDEGHRGCGG